MLLMQDGTAHSQETTDCICIQDTSYWNLGGRNALHTPVPGRTKWEQAGRQLGPVDTAAALDVRWHEITQQHI